VKCNPILGQWELEFSGVKAQLSGGADFADEFGRRNQPASLNELIRTLQNWTGLKGSDVSG